MTGREQSPNKLILVWTAFAAMPAILNLPREAAGIGLVALVVFPVVAVWIAKRTLMVADPIVIIGVMWVLAAGLPVIAPWLYKEHIWLRISDQSFDAATLWMYRSWAACSLAYWAVKCLPTRRVRPPSPAKALLADNLRVAVGIAGLSASIAHVVMSGGQAYSHLEGFASTTTLDQIVYELRQLSKIYIFLYFFARGRGSLLEREHWLLYGILATYLLIFAASASKGVAIELIAMWVLGNAAGALRGNIFRELVVGAVALTLTYWIFLWVTAYRAELRMTVSQAAGSVSEVIDQQLAAAEQALVKVATGQPIGSYDNPYDVTSMFDRLGLVSAFATVLDITGAQSPYENAGASFISPIYAILPRSMFDEKAQFFGSGELAQLLGWEFGGFSVTLPGSVFWAWGFEGLLPTMLVLGVTIALLDRRSVRDDVGGLYARVLLMCLILYLLEVGKIFQSIAISAVRVLLFLALLHVAVAVLWPAYRARQMVRRPAAR